MSGVADTGNALMENTAASLAASRNADVGQVVDAIRTVGNETFIKWFGQPIWMVGANGPMATPRPDVCYLVAGFTQDNQAKILHLSSSLPFNFAPNLSTTGFSAIGCIRLALYLLNRLYRRGIDLDVAKDLAAYCILETASQDGKVGGPMRMAIVRAAKDTEIIAEDEIAALGKRVDKHRDALTSSFLALDREEPALARELGAKTPPRLAQG